MLPSGVASLEFPAVNNPISTSSFDADCAPVTTAGLHRTPLSGGVENATLRCDLPSPEVAVRNLVEQAQVAHLCTSMSAMHHRRAGYPFGTLVEFAADGAGFPIFQLSPLAIQTRNILEDPRCSMVMQMPGWTGLANARVTIFGDVYKLSKEYVEDAEQIFHQKYSRMSDEGRWVSGTATYFRMDRILDIYFVGGFGTVQWVDVSQYTSTQPDSIVIDSPQRTLQALNTAFAEELRLALARPGGSPADDAAIISIDSLGADIRLRIGGEYSVERIGFNDRVRTETDAHAALKLLIDDAQAKRNRCSEKCE